ncbi:Zinc transporter ZIP9 [Grifola frondosa]|uniref:Zinc transporter ZIP9 n=1 Tax=Grifola frondosa TaxID=5627 RepID=A0A1C7LVI1_GRIFR|nr:Zinc transporter ZIP9 [Grifola frondosa]
MSGLVSVLVMSALLGAAAFGTGMLPLSVAFSKSILAKLSTFGTGLLLGAALGVIIPEGIETLVSLNASSGSQFPTSTIALSLLTGFMFMLVVERFLSRTRTPPPSAQRTQPDQPASPRGVVEFDVELGELERTEGIEHEPSPASSATPAYHYTEPPDAETRTRAYPLTLGLVVHALADGLALGSAALSSADSRVHSGGVALPSGLSIVVFFALIIHKAPTALALTTSLLSTSLPHAECKKHLAIFSAATPLGTLVSYAVLSFFGNSSGSNWPGIALLFSGGTFLYVATVLQPVLGHSSASEDISEKARTFYIILGMLVPYSIGAIFGDDHGHGA